MTRKEANMEIVRLLVNYINDNPDQRFGQILRNVGVVVDYWNEQEMKKDWMNHFNEEPQAMLDRMLEQMKGG